MPHKHKRQKTGDNSIYEQPPTSIVKPLRVKHASTGGGGGGGSDDAPKKRRSRNNKDYQDDTPKEFARLMQFKQTGKRISGLDNGRVEKRKRDVGASKKPAEGTQETTTAAVPRIQPGERLRDFAARVDHALPVAGLIAKNKDVKEQRQTRHEKKLQRLVNNWKKEEAKRIEKAEEEWEEAEEKEEEDKAQWGDSLDQIEMGMKGKKNKRRGSDAEDPWAVLKTRREKPKGVFDVVQAPPQFTKVPKDFKIREGAKVNVTNVPNLGSLRRQEILSETRQDVINRYREMMQAKRGDAVKI